MTRRAIWLVFICAACGAGPGGGGGGGGDGPRDAPIDLGPALGGVTLSQQAWLATSGVMRRTTAGAALLTGPVCAGQAITAECSRNVACPPYTALDAGPISITGGAVSPITLVAGAGEIYSYVDDADPVGFTAGATVGFSAAGAAFPAFSGSVTAPGPLTGVTPDPLAGPIPVDASSDTLVRWTAGDGDELELSLFGGDPFVDVDCRIPDSGSFAVPASVAQAFAQGTVQLQLARSRFTEIAADGGHVELSVSTLIQGTAAIGGGIAASCTQLAACCPLVPIDFRAQCQTDAIARVASTCASDLATAIAGGYCH